MNYGVCNVAIQGEGNTKICRDGQIPAGKQPSQMKIRYSEAAVVMIPAYVLHTAPARMTTWTQHHLRSKIAIVYTYNIERL